MPKSRKIHLFKSEQKTKMICLIEVYNFFTIANVDGSIPKIIENGSAGKGFFRSASNIIVDIRPHNITTNDTAKATHPTYTVVIRKIGYIRTLSNVFNRKRTKQLTSAALPTNNE